VSTNDQHREALTQLLEQSGSIAGRFSGLRRLPNSSPGHFSALLSADDAHTNRRVALKFLLPLYAGGYRDDSFEREAAILEELRGQPDVVQLVAPRQDFIEMLRTDQGLEVPLTFTFYALELAQTDVGTMIANAQWSPEQLLVAFRSMCRAVQRLHSRQTAHRDLKPPNFLVMADGSIKLSDFGTARRFDGSSPALATYTGPIGDLRYSAPELLAGLHQDTPEIALVADFFSLGAILFEMFSGTILGLRLYDGQFVSDLCQAMTQVAANRRRHVFDQLITTITDARPIPSVASFGSQVPGCLRDLLDGLIRRLTALDYRVRLTDFSRVFNRIDVCLLVLRNEERYQLWLRNKRRRREIALARQRGEL
jgi:serine/threonine protein kinase